MAENSREYNKLSSAKKKKEQRKKNEEQRLEKR